MSRRQGTEWVCTDCFFAAAGFSEDERGEAYPAEVLSRLDGYEMTTGLTPAEHDSKCPIGAAAPDWTGEDECTGCEEGRFSTSDCDGCGSSLGGDRYPLTVWTTEATA